MKKLVVLISFQDNQKNITFFRIQKIMIFYILIMDEKVLVLCEK